MLVNLSFYPKEVLLASLSFLSQRICASNSFFWLLPASINRNPPCCYTLDLLCSKETTFHSLDVSHSVSGLNGIILWYFDSSKDCWPPVGAWREHKWALFGIIWDLELSGTIWNYFDSIKDCWPAAGAGGHKWARSYEATCVLPLMDSTLFASKKCLKFYKMIKYWSENQKIWKNDNILILATCVSPLVDSRLLRQNSVWNWTKEINLNDMMDSTPLRKTIWNLTKYCWRKQQNMVMARLNS